MLMSEYNYEQDIEVQREEAFEEGEKRGQKRFAALAEKLIDVIKAAQDFELCEKLYQEYDIE